MVTRIKRRYPALKHGGYSADALLPGEDRAAFEKLHRRTDCRAGAGRRARGRYGCKYCSPIVAKALNLATFTNAELAHKSMFRNEARSWN